MSKATEKCPGCQSERVGIQEGVAYFKCGSYCSQNDGQMIFQSEACKNAKPVGLFNQE